MDYTILITFFVGISVLIGGFVLRKFLISKGITVEEITDGTDIAESVLLFVKDTLKAMNIENQKIDVAYGIIIDGLEYLKLIYINKTREEAIESCLGYTKRVLLASKIEVNESMEALIKNALIMSYNIMTAIENKKE